MSKLFTEASITGEKLQHMIHEEDLLLHGTDAAHFALKILYDIFETLKGGKGAFKSTLKIDGCFSPATLIATDRGILPIYEAILLVQAGETLHVKGFNHQSEAEEMAQLVRGITQPSGKPWVRVHTGYGEFICTADHPVYTTNRGYVEAGLLGTNDELLVTEA